MSKETTVFQDIGKRFLEFIKDTSDYTLIYEVMGAIRGCDIENESLKYIFTARIRYLLGLKWGFITIRTHKVISEIDIMNALKVMEEQGVIKKRKRNQTLIWAYNHYLGHIRSAIYAMSQLEIIDQKEAWFLENLAEWFTRTIGYNHIDSLRWVSFSDEFITK